MSHHSTTCTDHCLAKPTVGVVAIGCDGEFDHSVAFHTVREALAYVAANGGDGCWYQVWMNGIRLNASGDGVVSP